MSTKMNYDSYGNSIEGTDYCSGVETFAQNLIEDNESEATMIFPSPNGWISPRTKDYKLTDENCSIILPQNIYKLVHVWLRPIGTKVGFTIKDDGFSYDEFRDENNKTFEEDVSDYILPVEKWKTLTVGYVYTGIHKDTTLYYNSNGNEIFINGDTFRGFGSWTIPTNKFYNYFIGAVLRDKGEKYKRKNSAGIESSLYNIVPISTDPRQWQFRVEYIPMTSDIKIRARKSAKTNIDYIQPINQRAEVNSASALGKFLYNTAQKTGTEQITVVKWYQQLSDIPPLGCRVRHNGEHYILTANTCELTNCVQIKVTHTLSKNWSNKSQHVAVDQKYRNYKIPADMLWRNLYWEDFIEISKEDHTVEFENSGSLMYGKWIPRLLCKYTNDHTVTSLYLSRRDAANKKIGVVVPCSTLGIANSIVFTASMIDNLSAGLRMNPDGDKQYCEEVYYCDSNGKLEQVTITLAKNIRNFNAEQYPYAEWSENEEDCINVPDDLCFNTTFDIYKDPGEALKFTYQCHFVSDNVDILIGNKLAETHRLVKKRTQDGKFRFWRLTHPIRQGVDKVYNYDGENVLIEQDLTRERYWKVSTRGSDNMAILELGKSAKSYLNKNDAGWAITDENNNLYIGCNDISQTELYFTHLHKRK